MRFTQKRFSNRVSFDLGEEKLRYSIQDNTGRRGFSVDYLDFDPSFEDFEERNVWFRNVGLLWLLIGAVSVGAQFARTGTVSGSLWLTLGAVLLLVCLSIRQNPVRRPFGPRGLDPHHQGR